ncbi:hypothetical protein [Cellvibrio polysaccharolyticus]|uniref:hypothetical protein n=1 Tax=Cellvibrio polysaccharolyticus TaxID=2082724 RepID=UPI00187F071C|nr:hypothetical protein [Cellvibrio polysaccharolyticus]
MRIKSTNRAKIGKPITITFGVRQTKLISDQANKQNKTPRDFIVESSLEAAQLLLKASK